MGASSRSVDELADQLDRRAARARAASATEAGTERYLDAVLLQHGFHCLHDCVSPGSGRANVDHVVIGPSGIWVIDDERLTGAVTVTDGGELWSGRHSLAPQLDKARGQADAVSRALGGAHTMPILSLRSSTVPGGALERDGVVITTALTNVAEVIVRGMPRLLPDEVTRLASSATGALRPRRAASPAPRPPTSASAATPLAARPAPEVVPSWMVTPTRTPSPAPVRHRPRRRSKGVQRAIGIVVGLCVTIGAVVAAFHAVHQAIDERTPSTTAVGHMTVVFECRHPGTGWTEVVQWSGLGQVKQITWITNPGGLHLTTLPYGTTATRDGIGPSEHSLVTLHPAERTQAADAPATSC